MEDVVIWVVCMLCLEEMYGDFEDLETGEVHVSQPQVWNAAAPVWLSVFEELSLFSSRGLYVFTHVWCNVLSEPMMEPKTKQDRKDSLI